MQRRWVEALLYLLLIGLPVLVGLAFTASLLVDYLHPVPVFCEVGGGCDRVRASAYSHLFGIPLPVVGAVFFTASAALCLLRGPRVRALALGLGGAGALAALGFVWLQQFVLHDVCRLCMVVDSSALVLSGGVIVRYWRAWEPPLVSILQRAVGASLALVFFVAPLGAGFAMKPKDAVPPPIAEEIRKTPARQVCVVDFVDFECPFCRMTHLELAPVVSANASRVRFVRKMVPLHMHPHAMDAARAACCGEKLGHADEMADALFRAEDLTASGCEKVAQTLGLDLPAYRACVGDPQTDARIKAESAEFKASRGHGLPTIWFDREKIEGATQREEFEEVMRRALTGKS